MALLACPFCREMYEAKERTTCPVCGVTLAPFTDLPRSHEGLDVDEVIDPLDEPLPATYAARGRGLLVVLGLLGLAMFFLPWMHQVLPEITDYSGFTLSRRLGWPWGAGVAWFILVPTVFTRRTIRQLRGARVAAAFLAAFPGITAAILIARVPHSAIIPLRFSFEWAIGGTLICSALAIVASIRLGGRTDVIEVRHGSSHGETIH